MMVYVSGINERFNSDIVKTHNKNQYIYQSTYSIKDSAYNFKFNLNVFEKKSIFSSCKNIKGLF